MSLDQEIREANRTYEEFEPPSDWDHEEGSDTLILMLPGFKKEQLRVQVTSTRVLRVSGERQISENKWRRFRKEFPMPSDSDTGGISAKFEAGILYVKLLKVINKQPPTTTTPTPTPTPKQEAPKPQPQQPTTTHQKPNNAQVSDKRDKAAAESKSEGQKTKADEEDFQKKPKKEKGKEGLKDDEINNKVAKERVEGTGVSKVEEKQGTGSDDHGGLSKSEGKMEKRSLTMEMLSLQRREYMNALSGLVDEVKKQKKLVNMLLLIFFVLLIGIYVKNVIKSYF